MSNISYTCNALDVTHGIGNTAITAKKLSRDAKVTV